jgi:hypothetical protein
METPSQATYLERFHAYMPSFDIDPERINLFDVGDRYLFKHYFERTDIFDAISEYYNGDDYRFEVPTDELKDVRDALDEQYYKLVVIDDPEPYCVVKEQYTPHADILRNSVAHWSRDDHSFFLMKDELSVREAREAGASPISETSFVVGL